MDFFFEQERKKNTSRIGALIARLPAVARLRADASEAQVLEAMRGLVRLSQDAHASGPLSGILRQDSSIRAASSRVEHAIEVELARLIERLGSQDGLRRGFDIVRGHYPRVARDMERKLFELRRVNLAPEKTDSV